MRNLIKNKSLVYGVLIVLAISILVYTIYQEYRHILDDQIAADQLVFDEFGRKVDLHIKETLTFIYGLRGFVISQLDEGITTEKFNMYSSESQIVSTYIKNFSIAPNNIQEFVFPLIGNEITLGYDLGNDPRENVRKDIEKAMKTGNIVLSGPYELRQGSLGMVVRNPIFKNGYYWGIVNVVVDVETILTDAMFGMKYSNIDFSIYNNEGVFWQTGEVEDFNVEYPIKLLGGKWLIRGYISEELSKENLYKLIRQAILYIIAIATGSALLIRLISNNYFLSYKIRGLVYTDVLTKLPNRRALDNSIDNLISQKISFGLAFIDLDDFKNINDNLGHSIGDEVLVEITRRIQQVKLYESYRWGGDEFILIWRGDNPQQFKEIVTAVTSRISLPINLNGEEYRVASTSGISFFPSDGSSKDEIVKLADATMYIAKTRGKNQVLLYDTDIGDQLQKGYLVERKLQRAILNGDLEVYYQPQQFINNKNIASVEALVRWKDENGDFIPPTIFIPIAEQHGLINRLDEYVLESVASQINDWKKVGINLKVAVNISAKHFTTSIIYFLEDLLVRYKLKSSDFELEITETAAVSNFEYTKELIHLLQQIGFSVALDDFGTGFSSLNYLSELHCDIIKIDRSFISKLESDSGYKEYAIIKSIVDISSALNLSTIAEGVETEEQLSIVSDIGCNAYQGYYLSKPISADEFTKWFKDRYQ